MSVGFDLRLLSAFVALAEEQHFRRAAERLHLTQPVLSRHLQQLEREVGVRLLERTTRRVELTDAGRVFLDASRQLLHDAERAAVRAQRAAHGEIGWLTLGFVDSAAFALLPALLRELAEARPELTVRLRELSTEPQLVALREDVDVGVLREVDTAEGLVVRPLVTEPLCAALPSGHPLAERDGLRLAELADEPFVLFPRPQVPRVHDHLLAICDTAGFRPRIRAHALQYTTLLALVSAGQGVALVPTAARAIRRPDVAMVPLTDRHATSQLSLGWPEGPEPAALQAVVRCAEEVAARLAADTGLGEVPAALG